MTAGGGPTGRNPYAVFQTTFCRYGSGGSPTGRNPDTVFQTTHSSGRRADVIRKSDTSSAEQRY